MKKQRLFQAKGGASWRGLFVIVVALLTFVTGLGFWSGFATQTEAANWSDSGVRASSFARGNGTEQNPYEIETAAQMGYFSYIYKSSSTLYDSKYYKVVANIDLSENDWKAPTTEFKGTFDGGGNIITGIRISGSANNTGFFQKLDGATVKNLFLWGEMNVSGSRTEVGGVAGLATNSTINKVATKITVNADNSSNVGGIVGKAENTIISNSYNLGDVTAKGDVGGIVGFTNSKIENVYNSGTIKGSTSGDKNAGGIAGKSTAGIEYSLGIAGSTAGIENSFNLGTVSGQYAGGIVGNLEGSIKNVENKAAITGQSYAGGIAASASSSSLIENVHNRGGITSASNHAGGIVGIGKGAINDASNTGYVSARSEAGGIIGFLNSGSVYRSYNSGSVTARLTAGGIVGDMSTSSETSIYNSRNTGSVSSESIAGGIVGRGVSSGIKFITDCLNSGEVTVSGDYDGTSSSAKSSGLSAGGIGGWLGDKANIYTSRNSGNVNGAVNVGGVVGLFWGKNSRVATVATTGIVKDNGATNSGRYIGAFIGRNVDNRPNTKTGNHFYSTSSHSINKAFGTSNGKGVDKSNGEPASNTSRTTVANSVSVSPDTRTSSYTFNLGTAWAIKSIINNNNPHLKDFYW